MASKETPPKLPLRKRVYLRPQQPEGMMQLRREMRMRKHNLEGLLGRKVGRREFNLIVNGSKPKLRMP